MPETARQGAIRGPLARYATLAVLLLGLALLVAHAARLWFYTEDDAYIVMRYARNLARGYGLVFNIGQREWGSTTTLLPVLLAPFYWLGIELIVIAKAIGLLSALGLALVVWRIAARHAPDHRASFVLLPLAAFSPLVLWSVAGLETALFTFLIVSAVWAALAESSAQLQWRVVPASAALLLLATLTRNDAPVYAPVMMLAVWDATRPRRFAQWIVVFAVGSALLWGAHFVYYGAWLPNPFLAKVAGIGGRTTAGWDYLKRFADAMEPAAVLLAPSAVLVLGLGARRLRREALVLLAALAISLAYPVWAGGDWMPLFRMFAPTMAFAAPLTVWAISLLIDRAGRLKTGAEVALALGAVALSVSVYRAEFAWTTRLHVLKTANDFFLRVGELAKGTPADLTYALSDIGGFGWASDAPILDTAGLADRRVASRPHDDQGPRPLAELESDRPEVLLPMIYAGDDDVFKRRVYAAARDLAFGRFNQEAAPTLLKHPRFQHNAEIMSFVLSSGAYQLINIGIFPCMPQYYLVLVRKDAMSRVPASLRTVHLGLGIAEYETGDRTMAMQFLEDELRSNPYDERGFFEQAARLSKIGEGDRARAMIDRAIDLNPREVAYRALRGDTYANEKRYPEAVREYEQCVRIDSKSPEAFNALGFYLGVLERYDEAVEALSTAVALRPDFAPARNNLDWVSAEREKRRGTRSPQP